MRTLIVEDELIIAADLQSILEDLGYEVVGIARTAADAEQTIEQEQVDLVLLDIVLSGDRDGVDLAHVIRRHQSIPIVFVTSHADENTVRRAKAIRPEGYLVKPFTREDVYASIEIALSHFSDQERTAEAVQESEAGGLPAYRLRKVKAHIHRNFADDLRLSELADVAGMSKFHFCRMFRQSTGVTPYQYLLGVRIDRAKRLLQTTASTVGEISQQVGFNSQSQFNRAFKKLEGTTPAVFRKSS